VTLARERFPERLDSRLRREAVDAGLQRAALGPVGVRDDAGRLRKRSRGDRGVSDRGEGRSHGLQPLGTDAFALGAEEPSGRALRVAARSRARRLRRTRRRQSDAAAPAAGPASRRRQGAGRGRRRGGRRFGGGTFASLPRLEPPECRPQDGSALAEGGPRRRARATARSASS
jgi:hypothetical protein